MAFSQLFSGNLVMSSCSLHTVSVTFALWWESVYRMRLGSPGMMYFPTKWGARSGWTPESSKSLCSWIFREPWWGLFWWKVSQETCPCPKIFFRNRVSVACLVWWSSCCYEERLPMALDIFPATGFKCFDSRFTFVGVLVFCVSIGREKYHPLIPKNPEPYME